MVLGLLALLFMALPALNLVNLSLSRILERASEIGVRKAFGASSRTLVGQFLVENVILTLLGSLIGLILTAVVLRIIAASDLIPYANMSINFRAFLYGVVRNVARRHEDRRLRRRESLIGCSLPPLANQDLVKVFFSSAQRLE